MFEVRTCNLKIAKKKLLVTIELSRILVWSAFKIDSHMIYKIPLQMILEIKKFSMILLENLCLT